MQEETLLDWATAYFDRRIRKLMTLAAVSEKAGLEKSYAAGLKNQKLGARIGMLFKLLRLAGDEVPQDFLHPVTSLEKVEPARLLACNRRRAGMAPSPFLLEIAPKVLALTTPEPPRKWRRQLKRIRRLEKIRTFDIPRAQASLEKLVRQGVALLAQKARPAQAFCDLSCAFASLAVVYRSAGRLDDALDALLLAWFLLEAADDPLADGVWHQKSAYLLADLDRIDRALEFIQTACMHFVEAGATDDQARTVLDHGYLLSRQGRSQEACRQLRRALKLLPVDDREYRFAAHQILAGELARLGDTAQALVELETAEPLVGSDLMALAALNQSRAKVCLAQGSPQGAYRAYQNALRILRVHGSPLEVAEVSVELAALLRGKKNRPELDVLAAGGLEYVAAIECDREAREIFEDLAALVALNRVTADSLNTLRARLAQPPHQVAPIGARRKPEFSHLAGIASPAPDRRWYRGCCSVANLRLRSIPRLPASHWAGIASLAPK